MLPEAGRAPRRGSGRGAGTSRHTWRSASSRDKSGLQAIRPSCGVARSGKTEGYCRFARALQYGLIACSKGRPHLISGSLRFCVSALKKNPPVLRHGFGMTSAFRLHQSAIFILSHCDFPGANYPFYPTRLSWRNCSNPLESTNFSAERRKFVWYNRTNVC
jgi:hypothetical protein